MIFSAIIDSTGLRTVANGGLNAKLKLAKHLLRESVCEDITFALLTEARFFQNKTF